MPVSLTTITGPIYLPNGATPTGGRVSFELSSWDQEEGEALIISGPVYCTIDENGQFSVELYTSTAGINSVHYRMFVIWEDSELSQSYVNDIYVVAPSPHYTKKYIGSFSLSGPGPFQVSDLTIISETNNSSFDAYLEMKAFADRIDLGVLDEAVAATSGDRAAVTLLATQVDLNAEQVATDADTVAADRVATTQAAADAEASADVAQASADVAQAAAEQLAGIVAFGASPGALASTNSAAVTAALTAAGNGPVLVPYSDTPYDLTALTPQQRQRLYGPGDIRVGGVQQWINSAPYIGPDVAPVRVINLDWQPQQWHPSVDGSLYNGAIAVQMNRTGGYAGYGAILSDVLVDDDTGLFDSGITSWVHARIQTGNNIFGGWFGAGSARPDLGETYTGGLVVGLEANAYTSAVVGLQADVGTPMTAIGIQSVPDAVPRRGAAGRGPVRNGHFAFAAIESIHGDKWWTGYLVSVDALAAGGIGHRIRGGSVLGNAPSHGILLDGYYTNGLVFGGNFSDALSITGTGTRGINLSTATLSGAAIRLADAQLMSWGGATITGAVKGLTFSIGAGTSTAVADDFTVFANSFNNRLIHARWTGVEQIGFLGAMPVGRVTLPAAATDAATTQALANAIRTALINFGLCA